MFWRGIGGSLEDGMNSILKVVGKTSEGQLLVGGTFTLVESHGLTLSQIGDRIYEDGYLLSLDSFVQEAVRGGWTMAKAIAKVREALAEKYGLQYAKTVSSNLHNTMIFYHKAYWPEFDLDESLFLTKI